MFHYGDEVYYGPELFKGYTQAYWVAGRLYDEDKGCWRYFLKEGETPGGEGWGWASEAALRHVGQKGITRDASIGGYKVVKYVDDLMVT